MKDAAAALKASGAVRVVGTQLDPTTKAPEAFDLHIQSDGTSGSVVLQGVTVQFIALGTSAYLKAPAAFYVDQKASAAAAAEFANRWVQVPASAGFGSFTLATLSQGLSKPATASTAASLKVRTGKLNGKSVVIVSKPDGSQLFLAATGKPLPLKTVDTAKSTVGAKTYNLSGYGQRITITAPSGAVAESGITA